MGKRTGLLAGTLCAVLALNGYAGLPGEKRCKIKGKVDEFKKSQRIAILTFSGNTIITGTSGADSLVSGAPAGNGTFSTRSQNFTVVNGGGEHGSKNA